MKFTKDNLLLTIEEAAEILKVSKYTLYELVKRKQIPAQRVGRQLRINRELLNKYLEADISKYGNLPSKKIENNRFSENNSLKINFVGSHEPIVGLLAEFLKYAPTPVNLISCFTGSMEGIYALYRRKADIAGVHLWDNTTQEYNLPFLKYVLLGESATIINLVQRTQGWIVQPGNPLNLSCWEDISKKGLRFINRQKGSGTRLRIDNYLLQSKISPLSIEGYELEETSHFGVALRVANGEADAGIGIQSSAHKMGLDFIPLFKERYDIVCLNEKIETVEWQQLVHILNSTTFKNALKKELGYDTSLTGYEIGKVN